MRGFRECDRPTDAAGSESMSTPTLFRYPRRLPTDTPTVSTGTTFSVKGGASELSQAQILIEQLMTIARVSALEEMASGVAHELNQPLGAIATFSQAGERMLKRPEPMTSAALEVLQHINREAMNAGEGIRRIRKLFNHSGLKRPPTSMRDLLLELRPVLDLVASRHGARLEIEYEEALPLVAVDRLRIQHVLLTLVQNALEAPKHPDAANRVQVDVTSNRYELQISVSDYGIGIPEQHRPQIFRPFFTTKNEGTGLGLASSRSIIESHEGTIGFDDIEGGGTRFWFRLPALSGA
jgi:C4-dicarboxylate-specific signal transduction histidine kinase